MADDQIKIDLVVEAAQASRSAEEFAQKLTQATGSADAAAKAVEAFSDKARAAEEQTRAFARIQEIANRALNEEREAVEKLDAELNRAVATQERVVRAERQAAREAQARAEEAARTRQEAMDRRVATSQAVQATMMGEVGLLTAVGGAWIGTALAAERHTRALAILGDAYGEVQRQTRDTIDEQDALRVQQELSASGLRVTGQQLGVVARAAYEYAHATGTDTTEALERLSHALESGSSRGLRAFGLQAREGESRAAGFARQVGELEQRFRGTEPTAATLGDTLQATARSFTDLAQNLVAAFIVYERNNAYVRLAVTAFEGLGHAVGRANDFLETYVRENGGVTGANRDGATGANGFASAEDNVARAAHGAAAALHDLKQDMAGLDTGFRQGETAAESMTRRLAAMQTQLAALRQHTAQDRELARSLRFLNPGVTDDELSRIGLGDIARSDRRATAAGRRHARAEREAGQVDLLNAQLAEEVHVAERVHARLATLERERGETQEHFLGRLIRNQHAYNERAAELNEKNFRDAREAEDRARRAREQESANNDELARSGVEGAERNGLGPQLRAQLSLTAQASQTFAQIYARNINGALETTGRAVTSHFAAWINHREAFGDAVKGMAHDVLEGLAMQGLGQVVFWSAKAISDAAGVVTAPLVPGDLASVGAWAAVAALGGLGTAATSGGGGGASGGGGAIPAGAGFATPAAALPGGSGGSGGSGGDTRITINFGGPVFDKDGARDYFHGALRELQRRGHIAHGTVR